MLAMGIPAMSPSSGQTPVSPIQNNGGGNFDISAWKGSDWPRNHETYLIRWLHSDCRDVAYLYTYKLFDELVTEGVLGPVSVLLFNHFTGWDWVICVEKMHGKSA